MNIFKRKMTKGEIKDRIAKFEESVQLAEKELAALREKLTAALATGSGDLGLLQRRAAELDAVIASAPAARRLLQEALEEAKAHDAAPKLEAVLKKIEAFREALKKAGEEVERAWEGIGREIGELRDLEVPSGWYRLKILFQQETALAANPTGAESMARGTRAAAALQEFKTALLAYCSEWETPLRGILAGIDSEKPRKQDPLSQAELMQQHVDLLHGKK